MRALARNIRELALFSCVAIAVCQEADTGAAQLDERTLSPYDPSQPTPTPTPQPYVPESFAQPLPVKAASPATSTNKRIIAGLHVSPNSITLGGGDGNGLELTPNGVTAKDGNGDGTVMIGNAGVQYSNPAQINIGNQADGSNFPGTGVATTEDAPVNDYGTGPAPVGHSSFAPGNTGAKLTTGAAAGAAQAGGRRANPFFKDPSSYEASSTQALGKPSMYSTGVHQLPGAANGWSGANPVATGARASNAGGVSGAGAAGAGGASATPLVNPSLGGGLGNPQNPFNPPGGVSFKTPDGASVTLGRRRLWAAAHM